MKIDQIETTVLEMPYTKPLVTATNNFTVARGLLVKVITDGGLEGYGYSDLFPRTGETPETARHVIESVLRAKVVGKDLEDLVRLRAEIDAIVAGLYALSPTEFAYILTTFPLLDRDQPPLPGDPGASARGDD